MGWKGLIANRKKGSLSTVQATDIFVLEKPQVEQVETDPTVPSWVKNITEQDIQNFLVDNDTTYDVFTNTVDGLVPSPNRGESGGTEYSIVINSPSNGQEFTEGDDVIISATISEQSTTQSNITIVQPTEGYEHTEGEDLLIVAEITQGSSQKRFLNEYAEWEALPIQDWIEGFNNNIISGTVTGDNNKVITLTKRNGTTLQIPFVDNEGSVTGDDVINTLSFNDSNGVLTAVTSDGIQITANLDGRYSLIGHTHNYEDPLTFISGNLTKATRTGNNVKYDKLPKISVDISGSSPSVPTGYNTKWLNLTGSNPTLTISGTYSKDDEIEGTFSGTGELTIVGSGITLIYSETYHTNRFPKGGTFGLKFLSATSAALFGKQIPVGL